VVLPLLLLLLLLAHASQTAMMLCIRTPAVCAGSMHCILPGEPSQSCPTSSHWPNLPPLTRLHAFPVKLGVTYLQVLTPLSWPDLLWVAALPGISEELLFRGALIPALFPDWCELFSALQARCMPAQDVWCDSQQHWPQTRPQLTVQLRDEPLRLLQLTNNLKF